VEAMAAGAPVIALGQGGLLRQVSLPGRAASQPTGLLFGPAGPATALVRGPVFLEEGQLLEAAWACESRQRCPPNFALSDREPAEGLLERYWGPAVEDQGATQPHPPCLPLAWKPLCRCLS